MTHRGWTSPAGPNRSRRRRKQAELVDFADQLRTWLEHPIEPGQTIEVPCHIAATGQHLILSKRLAEETE